MKADISSLSYLTTSQCARILNVHPITIRRMVKAGKLPAIQIGTRNLRISKDYIQQLVEQSLTLNGDVNNATVKN